MRDVGECGAAPVGFLRQRRSPGRGAPRSCGRATVVALIALTFAGVGCVRVQIGGGPPEPLEEALVQGESGPKILLVDIDGVLRDAPEDGGPFAPPSESSPARVREQLDRARRAGDVRALLLRINSPGGSATASDVVHREIRRFAEEREVPVVAHLLGTAASGGYYVAMAADWVVAEPTTVTGSIGVVFFGLEVSGLMEKLGVRNQTLVAGARKDAGSWLRPLAPEERAQLQSILDDLHARFKSVVRDGRPALDAEAVERLADGRVFSADQALAAGLVDAIGGLEEAVAEAERRAGLASSRVVTYHRPREWKQNLYSRGPLPPRLEVDLLPGLPRLPRPSFLYLWVPGAGGL